MVGKKLPTFILHIFTPIKNTISMNISPLLSENVNVIKEKLKSSDVEFLPLQISNTNATLIYITDIVNKEALGEFVIKPLAEYKGEVSKENIKNVFFSPEKKEVEKISNCLEEVVSGKSVLLIDGLNLAFSFGLEKYEKRAITEPPTSTVLKGPREGFVESLPVNVSMIRRRLKTPDLTFEHITVGKISKTTIALCYVSGLADDKLVSDLRKKIKNIKINAVLDSSYVSKLIGEHRSSLFKQLGNTEKPDILISKILEGRVAIIVDGSPIALTAPYLLIEDFHSPSDSYTSPYTATLARILRFFAVFISIFLPAFFVASELFHLQLIPLSFLLTIVNSVKGIPLSPSYEMFFTLLIFETLNEASVRMPKYVGMVVSIVGGLVLGETAVNAGIISAPALMIIAFSGICLYTVPELEQAFSVLRLAFLVVGGSIGGYGLIIVSAFTLIYLVSFESFGAPLMAPFSPLIKNDLKDSIYKGFLPEESSTPISINYKKFKRENQLKERL